MSKIHLNVPTTTLQQSAMHQRMQKLGIQLKDGVIDESKLDQLRVGDLRGKAALESVLNADGTLNADGLAKLERGGDFAAVFRGRDSTVSAKTTNEARAVSMALSGAISSMNAASKRPTVTPAEVNRVARQLDHASGEYMRLLEKGALGDVDPKAVDDLVARFGQLEGAVSQFVSGTAQVRADLASRLSNSKGLDMEARIVLELVQRDTDTLLKVQDMARLLTTNLIPLAAPAEVKFAPLTPASAEIGDGPLGVGAPMYQRLAEDMGSGLIPKDTVARIAGDIQAITHDSRLAPDTVARAFHDLMWAHVDSGRSAYITLAQHLAPNGISSPALSAVVARDTFTELVSKLARESGGDEAKFEASVKPYLGLDKFVEFARAAGDRSLIRSTPRAATDAILDAMKGLDTATAALVSGDVARFEAALPQVKAWVGEARAGIAQSVLGDEPAPQLDVTRLQIAFDHLRRDREIVWGPMMRHVLADDGTVGSTKDLAAQLVLPPAAAGRVQGDPQLIRRVQADLASITKDLGAIFKMSARVDQLTGTV